MSDLSKFWDSVEQSLWDNVFGREFTRPDIFSLKDAKKFLLTCSVDHPEAKRLAIHIKPVGKRFQVSLLILDGKNEPIYTDINRVMGRQAVTARLDRDVNEFMNGEIMQYLDLDECR